MSDDDLTARLGGNSRRDARMLSKSRAEIAFMPPAPKHSRRWFQFGLGTIFVVVTLIAGIVAWFAWQIGLVRERERLLGPPVQWLISTAPENTTRVPWLWRQFVRAPVTEIALPKATFSEDQVRHFERLFPEAYVHRNDHTRRLEAIHQEIQALKNRKPRAEAAPARDPVPAPVLEIIDDPWTALD